MPSIAITEFKFTNRTSTKLHLHGLSSLISIDSHSTTSILHSNHSSVFISKSSEVNLTEKGNGERHEWIINPVVKFRKTRLIKLEQGDGRKCSLWIFQTKSKQQTFQHLIAFNALDVSNWMTGLPDYRNLSSLYIPGTHETLALHGFPISTCQSRLSSVTQQLEAGLRFLDFRFSLIKGELVGYHGIQNQFIKAIDALQLVYKFLEVHTGEVVILSVKQENSTPGFEVAFWNLINPNKSVWFTENRFPTLGEARGKILLFSRFSNRLQNGGLQPMRWPDNNAKVWDSQIGGIDLLVQDWYSIGSFTQIPEKVALVLSLFRPRFPSSNIPSTTPSTAPLAVQSVIKAKSILANKSNQDKPLPLRINFLSGATFLTAFPFIVAKGFFFGFGLKGVNERVLSQLLTYASTSSVVDGGEEEEGRSGVEGKRENDGGMILLQDYFEVPGGLTELMISWNF